MFLIIRKKLNFTLILLLTYTIVSCSFDYGQQKLIRDSSFSSAWEEESIPADEGWIRVPLCHEKEKCTETVKLPFFRLHSTNKDPGPPLFYLSGGPGDSGIESAKRGIFPYLVAYRKIGDVVIFDQRGTGKSRPDLHSNQSFNIPGTVSLNSERAFSSIESTMTSLKREMEGRGINLDFYNTKENAIDIDSLRSKLGYKQINILAHSYGTHLAMAYIKFFERKVNSVIFSGFNGLNDRLIYPEDTEAFISRIYKKTLQHEKFSRLFPDFMNTMKNVLDRFQKGQMLGDTLYFRSFDIQAATMLRSGDPEFVYALPKFFMNLQNERFEKLAGILQNSVKNRPLGTAMTYAMSSASSVSKEKLKTIEMQAERFIMNNARNYPFYHVDFRQHLGINALGNNFRQFDTTRVPVLFINGTLDGRTPIEDARRIEPLFPNHSNITIIGASHEVLLSTPELIDICINFWNGKTISDKTLEIFFEFESPQSAEILTKLENTFEKEGIQSVIDQIEEMVSNKSEYYITSNILISFGEKLLNQKRFEEALKLLEYGQSLFPDQPMILNYLGVAHLRMGNTDKAIKYGLEFSSVHPFDRRWAYFLNSHGISLIH